MKLVKIGAKVVKHSGYVTFQLAEVAVSRDLFREIPRLIDTVRPKPALARVTEGARERTSQRGGVPGCT